MEQLPRASSFEPETRYFTETPVNPSLEGEHLPIARPAATVQLGYVDDEGDAIAREIRADLPALIKIIFYLIAGIIVCSGAGLAVHTLIAGFK